MKNKDKTSFVIMKNWALMLMGLPEHETNQLIKKICNYEFDDPAYEVDAVVNAMFQSIEPLLKENDDKWECTRDKRATAGAVGGKASGEARREKSKTKQKEANVSFLKQNAATKIRSDANRAVIGTVTDTVSVSDSSSPPTPSGEEEEEEIKALKCNITYSDNVAKYKAYADDGDYNRYIAITNILFDAIGNTRDRHIAGQLIPYASMRDKLLQINSGHITQVMDALAHPTAIVHNVNAYILTLLYNAPDQYDTNKIMGQIVARQSATASAASFPQNTYDFDALEKKLLNY